MSALIHLSTGTHSGPDRMKAIAHLCPSTGQTLRAVTTILARRVVNIIHRLSVNVVL